MKRLLIILLLFPASGFCDRREDIKRLANMTCIDSTAVVEERPDVTFFRIIADSGEILVDINSTKTLMTQFDMIFMIELLYPEYGHWLFANNSKYFITNNQTTAGNVQRIEGITFKVFSSFITLPINNNFSVIKTDFRCARIHGYFLNIDPAFDIKKFDGYKMTALLWSSMFGLSNLAKNLVERGADVNQGNGFYGSPIIAAILANQPELVEFLIQRGANIIRHRRGFFSSLHVAAFAGSADVARILIDHGVNVDENENSGKLTPLHVAVLNGQCNTVDQLINKGANVNALALQKSTAFHMAVTSGHLDCGHKLIESGADINSRDSDGNTALILALIKEKEENILAEKLNHFLTEFNPDLNIRNNKGETAITIAIKKNFTRVAEFLKSKGAV